MPFLPDLSPPVFYRCWAADDPRGGVVFLHGVGEHSGLYARFALALNACGFSVWAIDQLGHGHTGGTLEDAYNIEALADNAEALLRLARRQAPGLPMVLAGHSMGGVTAALLASRPTLQPPAAMVLTGTPLGSVHFPDNILEIPMSADAQYLDDLSVDPLLPKGDIDFDRLAAGFRAAFGAIVPAMRQWPFPALLLNGEHDPVAPPPKAAQWAKELPCARLYEVPGGRHDILNDTAHAEVARLVCGFVFEATSALIQNAAWQAG